MALTAFADTLRPPFCTVIFSSQRRDADDAGYAAAAERMVALAAMQPGFLGVESARGADGFGITVSYWESEAAILAWKRHAEHAEARASGRHDWYSRYEMRIGRVERAYGWVRDAHATSATTTPDTTAAAEQHAAVAAVGSER
jgi:heme-degrading monooxygenase HmoA